MSVFAVFKSAEFTVVSISWSSRNMVAAAGAAAIVAAGAVLVVVLHRPDWPLPQALHKQSTFATYFPDKPWSITTNQASYQNGVLRFAAQQGSTQLVFTEQATPLVFNEVPQYFPTLLAKMNQYASFDSTIGAVYLTKPTELKGGQTAVADSGGTLLFVRPDHDLSDNSWRQLFESLRPFK